MGEACSALKSHVENGTRCANGFLDSLGCKRPDLRGAPLPPCMREDQTPLPHRIDWAWLTRACPAAGSFRLEFNAGENVMATGFIVFGGFYTLLSIGAAGVCLWTLRGFRDLIRENMESNLRVTAIMDEVIADLRDDDVANAVRVAKQATGEE